MFSLTLANLIEFQQPEIAAKFTSILKEILRSGKTLDSEFKSKNHIELIQMFWSLMQIEKVVLESQDPTRDVIKLITRKNLSFLNDVNIETLEHINTNWTVSYQNEN